MGRETLKSYLALAVGMAQQRSTIYRGYRIAGVRCGRTWTATVFDLASNLVETDIEGGTAQKTMVKAMQVVDAKLKQASPTKG
jgi:hypothetical protein